MHDLLDMKQRTTCQTAAGTWVLKRLGLRAQLRVGGRAAEIVGGVFDQAPQKIQVAAWMLATIELATEQAPPQWDWDAAPDDEILGQLYDHYVQWDASFRAPVASPQDPTGGHVGAQSPVLVSPNVSDSSA